jgi:Xaa-Pro dipeptidase
MTHNRFSQLISLINSSGIDALAINPGSSLTYLTGLHFHLMERPTVLLIVPGEVPALILPELEALKVKQSAISLQPFIFGDNPASWQDAFNQAVKALGLDGKRIGVEPERLRFLELHFLETAAPNSTFVPAAEVFANLRMYKDAGEIQAMRKAVKIAQMALIATLPAVKSGVSEREISAELTLQLLKAGSDSEMPFSPIVSSGPNSANPHASPSERRLAAGDLLVIDWGASFRGYCSDLTRTFAIGEPVSEYQQIARAVMQANKAGREAARPGIMAGDVDKAARDVIERAGYGQYFTHRVGHGLGMEGHEPPYMFGENTLILAPGMTFTVEPGIYLPGRNGVRIEDNVVITEEGAETLSDLPRELVRLE